MVGKHEVLMDTSFTMGGELFGDVTLTASFANYPTNTRTNSFILTIEAISIECSELPKSDNAQKVYMIGDQKLSFRIQWIERSRVQHTFTYKSYVRDKQTFQDLPDAVTYDEDSDKFSVYSSSESIRGNYTLGLNFTEAAFPGFLH